MIALLFLWFLIMGDVESNKIQVAIENIRGNEGKVYVALYEAGSEFPKDKHYVKRQFKNARRGEINFIFDQIPTGEYAIAVFHDLNDNVKLDTNLFGIPKEPYGFSNNFRPRLAPPKFSDCAVSINKDVNIRIKIK